MKGREAGREATATEEASSSIPDVVVIREAPYSPGQYYRVDFIVDSVQRLGFSSRLYACGPVSGNGALAVGFGISDSKLLRLLNFLAYLITLRSFPHFGFLLRMWSSLTCARPKSIVFYDYWTGLFLLFWRKVTGSGTSLVWEWFDLIVRTSYYGRRIGLVGRLFLHFEEQIAPSYFDALIVPTRFAQTLLERWGHPASKIHVLGEFRELNPYLDAKTLERRVDEVRKSRPIRIAWVGVIRPYQLDGLVQFLRILSEGFRDGHETVIDIIGPAEVEVDSLRTLGSAMPPGITYRWHGSLSLQEMDRLLARSHIAIHPIPHELFCDFLYSRKMADYLAAALPVAFSAVGGLCEIGASFGIPFHLDDADSVIGAILELVDPENYRSYALAALTVAERELSKTGLSAKGEALVGFLAEVAKRSSAAFAESAT